MGDRAEAWVVVATYGAVWEAEFAAETLREAGIPAHVEGGQHVGIFGMGYQGPSLRGVRVRVPWHREEDARELLEPGDDTGDDPPPPFSRSPAPR